LARSSAQGGGFKKRYLLLAIAAFLAILLFRHQLPEPLGSFGIAVVEGLKAMTHWVGRHLSL
jgi:hypothetical protein